MKVNFKNLTENLIIIIVVGLLCGGIGAYTGYKSASESALSMIEAQQPIIEMAIAKNTSEIENTFTNEFKKIKNKKGEAINIIIDPSTNSVFQIKTQVKSLQLNTKKAFLNAYFLERGKARRNYFDLVELISP